MKVSSQGSIQHPSTCPYFFCIVKVSPAHWTQLTAFWLKSPSSQKYKAFRIQLIHNFLIKIPTFCPLNFKFILCILDTNQSKTVRVSFKYFNLAFNNIFFNSGIVFKLSGCPEMAQNFPNWIRKSIWQGKATVYKVKFINSHLLPLKYFFIIKLISYVLYIWSKDSCISHTELLVINTPPRYMLMLMVPQILNYILLSFAES